jgi:hypothetical protein
MLLRVLWTKQLTRKSKTWNDGFLELRDGRSVVLSDDDRTQLASGRLPSALEVTAGLEGMHSQAPS